MIDFSFVMCVCGKQKHIPHLNVLEINHSLYKGICEMQIKCSIEHFPLSVNDHSNNNT